jgi:hypothetical protein
MTTHYNIADVWGKFEHRQAAERLMSLPLDAERPRLRDRVPLSGAKLESRAAKYLTLADEYAKRRTFARDMANPPRRDPPNLFTRQLPRDPRHFKDLHAGMSAAEYVAKFERNAGHVREWTPAERLYAKAQRGAA